MCKGSLAPSPGPSAAVTLDEFGAAQPSSDGRRPLPPRSLNWWVSFSIETKKLAGREGSQPFQWQQNQKNRAQAHLKVIGRNGWEL